MVFQRVVYQRLVAVKMLSRSPPAEGGWGGRWVARRSAVHREREAEQQSPARHDEASLAAQRVVPSWYALATRVNHRGLYAARDVPGYGEFFDSPPGIGYAPVEGTEGRMSIRLDRRQGPARSSPSHPVSFLIPRQVSSKIDRKLIIGDVLLQTRNKTNTIAHFCAKEFGQGE